MNASNEGSSSTRPSVIQLNKKTFLQKEKHTAPHHIQYKSQLMDKVASRLVESGMCIVDNFLPEKIGKSIAAETEALYSAGKFYEAVGMYCKSTTQNTRSDRINWVNGLEPECKAINVLIKSFQKFIGLLAQQNTFKEKNMNLTHKSHVQLSCFPEQSFGHRRHIDNPNNNGRLLTIVYYCNVNYNRHTDGGASRFYIKNKTYFIDVEPKFNRVVVYWSDDRVMTGTLPCLNKVFALTSWYFGTMDKTTEINLPMASSAVQGFPERSVFEM